MRMLDGNTAALNQYEHDQLQRDKLAKLKAVQSKRRSLLEHAATYHDDKELIDWLASSVQGGEFYDAFIRLCQDVLETADGDNVMVRPEFTKAVQDVALLRFGGEHA